MARVILFFPLIINSLSVNLRNTNIFRNLLFEDSTDLGLFRDLTTDEIINYYNSSSYKKGLKKEELLNYLQELISKGHKPVSHADAWNTNWQYFTLLDRDWDNDPLTQEEINETKDGVVGWKTTNVTCLPLYTDPLIFIDGTKTMVDREHVWPKSIGYKNRYVNDSNTNEFPYAGTDMHNLYMGDRHNNQNGHNNLPFGNVVDKKKAQKIESSTTGEVTGYVGMNKYGIKVYEPRDIDKGNIARALFYMATRYHNFKSMDSYEPALILVTNFTNDKEATKTISVNDTRTKPVAYGVLEDLLEWNKIDPVDNHERHRNNLCYNIVQRNRNPYIDYPEWADIAFGKSDKGIDLGEDNGKNTLSYSKNLNISLIGILMVLFFVFG